MNIVKKIIIMLALLLSLSSISNAESLPLFAQNAIVMEASTGEVLYEKNSNEKMYPASTTKLWTAHLVINNIDNLNKKVKVETDLSWVEPTAMFLKEGEEFTVRELLEVLMLKSANDVAVLLAVETSGSLEDFAKLMNDEAKRIGCKNTNFVNPNGLPDDNHYSTAYDMALMSREAVKNEILMEIVKKETVYFPANEYYPYERNYTNSNKFLTGTGQMTYKGSLVDYKYDIVDGLKTGYTSKAGRCLLTTAKVDDMRIITGVFNSKGDDVYTDSRALIDYAFDNYYVEPIVKNEMIKDELYKNILFSKSKKVLGYIEDEYFIVKNKKISNSRLAEQDNLIYKINMDKGIKTSVNKGDVIGSVEVYNNKELVKAIDVHAYKTIKPLLDKEQIILLTTSFIIITVISANKYRRRKKSKESYEIRSKYR